MAADLAGLVNPGKFKAYKKDPERMLADFNLYMETFSNFLTVIDQNAAVAAKKKALLKTVGGPDMVFLFDYVGKVQADATYEVALEAIKAGITGQTNQAMSRFKLFIGMSQENQPFST